MRDDVPRSHGSGNRNAATTPSDAQKLPKAGREDNRRKGESAQIAGEGSDRATRKQEKGDARPPRGVPGGRDNDVSE